MRMPKIAIESLLDWIESRVLLGTMRSRQRKAWTTTVCIGQWAQLVA
jgi:hypothetical protein